VIFYLGCGRDLYSDVFAEAGVEFGNTEGMPVAGQTRLDSRLRGMTLGGDAQRLCRHSHKMDPRVRGMTSACGSVIPIRLDPNGLLPSTAVTQAPESDLRAGNDVSGDVKSVGILTEFLTADKNRYPRFR